MEKRTPMYDLEGIKSAARDGLLDVSFSANQTVFSMGAIEWQINQEGEAVSKVCPECGGKMIREVRSVPYTYKDQTIHVDQPGDWCQSCAEGVLTVADVKATEKELHDFRARVDGLLTSVEIRNIRKKLKLTQKDAADIFGGGPNAFSRYERGEATQMKAVDVLLRLLDKHPALVKEVREEKKLA